jgi:hypothetical protein
MCSRRIVVIITVALFSLHNISAFQSRSNSAYCRTSKSNKLSLSPSFNDVSQIISTSISSATIEVASNEVIAKQIFEPQISTETGIGDEYTLRTLLLKHSVHDLNDNSSAHSFIDLLSFFTFFSFQIRYSDSYLKSIL